MPWRNPSPLTRFSIATLLWLPVCFAVWYFFSILFVLPLSSLVSLVMTGFLPDVVASVHPSGNELLVTTLLTMANPQIPGGPEVEILFKTNPLMYGYNIPLYTALVLAAPADGYNKIWAWIVGLLILLLIQTFGVSTDMLKILAFHVGEDARAHLAFSQIGYEATAIAYQIGYLILPAVSPLLLWVWQFRRFVSTLVDLPSAQSSAPPPRG